MSFRQNFLTADGRRIVRDMQRQGVARALRHHEWFDGVPGPIVSGFAELLLVRRELRARIKAEGVMRADGSVNPAVESFRKYKHTELGYLTAIAELKRERGTVAVDIFAQMAQAASAETVAEPADEPPENNPSS